eukprot:UN04558
MGSAISGEAPTAQLKQKAINIDAQLLVDPLARSSWHLFGLVLQQEVRILKLGPPPHKRKFNVIDGVSLEIETSNIYFDECYEEKW